MKQRILEGIGCLMIGAVCGLILIVCLTGF
jgi:hypothetical protein